jgi:hypothetical protein
MMKDPVWVAPNKHPNLIRALFLIASLRRSQNIDTLLRKNEAFRAAQHFRLPKGNPINRLPSAIRQVSWPYCPSAIESKAMKKERDTACHTKDQQHHAVIDLTCPVAFRDDPPEVPMSVNR